MNITVIGTGYVGLVTGTCLAEKGNNVICIDKNNDKVEKLKTGISPIYENKLEDLIVKNIKRNRLHFSTSIEDGVRLADIIFIAVGTPPLENGCVDMSQVDEVASIIGKSLDKYTIIVNKSTVPVGSAKRVREIIYNNLEDKNINFDVASNPEFLREGTAVEDTFNGDRIVIGSDSKKAIEKIKKLYYSFNIPFLITDPQSAEMIKYASNAFLATKISFINEIANVCEKVNADVREVAKGMGMDKRIGSSFLKAGIGFGGACFPKDVTGLIKIGQEVDYDFKIIKEVLNVNSTQRIKPIKVLSNIYNDNLKGLNIGLLGLAFKGGTDDLREARSLFIIEELYKRGANIKVFDPVAMDNAKSSIKTPITYCNSLNDAFKDSDAILLLTDWEQFINIDISKLKYLMRGNIFIDGRNMFEYQEMIREGLQYYAVGIGHMSEDKVNNQRNIINIYRNTELNEKLVASI